MDDDLEFDDKAFKRCWSGIRENWNSNNRGVNIGDKRKQKLMKINNLLNELNINVTNAEVQQRVTRVKGLLNLIDE